MTFLGIDIGTSAVKAVLVDDDEAIRGEAVIGIATNTPEPGISEQDPEEWWAATSAVIDDLRRLDPDGFAALRGIGLCGQMQAMVVLDESDRVLRPAMTWHRRPRERGIPCSSSGRCRMWRRLPARSRDPASRRPSFYGCARTSRIISSGLPACWGPRTTCVCG